MQGIPWKYRDEDLSALFEDCAPAVEAKVVISKDGRSRVRLSLYHYICAALHAVLDDVRMVHNPGWFLQGYGTVRFDSREDADKAVRELHSTELEGRTLTVKIDK